MAKMEAPVAERNDGEKEVPFIMVTSWSNKFAVQSSKEILYQIYRTHDRLIVPKSYGNPWIFSPGKKEAKNWGDPCPCPLDGFETSVVQKWRMKEWVGQDNRIVHSIK
jgi:hypothetical protein